MCATGAPTREGGQARGGGESGVGNREAGRPRGTIECRVTSIRGGRETAVGIGPWFAKSPRIAAPCGSQPPRSTHIGSGAGGVGTASWQLCSGREACFTSFTGSCRQQAAGTSAANDAAWNRSQTVTHTRRRRRIDAITRSLQAGHLAGNARPVYEVHLHDGGVQGADDRSEGVACGGTIPSHDSSQASTSHRLASY